MKVFCLFATGDMICNSEWWGLVSTNNWVLIYNSKSLPLSLHTLSITLFTLQTQKSK